MDIWSGLKLPIDLTGSNLKSDKCRPKLQLDGLDPEVVYRTGNDAPLEKIIFPEFRPRKRLKKMGVSEESDPIGVKRIPEKLLWETEKREPGNLEISGNQVKSEPMEWENDGVAQISLCMSEKKGA